VTVTITGQLHKLDAGAWVDLFALDLTPLSAGIVRFHAGTNALRQPVIWQGETYQPFPIQVDGFEMDGSGRMPRPRLRVANVSGAISTLVRQYEDFVGMRLTRKRTMVRFLDAVNFPGGTNASADPLSHLPDETYFVTQKTSETKLLVEFELGSALDLQGVMLPRRQIVSGICGWRYRDPGTCGYSGGPVADRFDQPTSNPAVDNCSRTLAGCKLRFGVAAVLPFGGFPGAGQASR
jgi:lambda family phage minor tail protein L